MQNLVDRGFEIFFAIAVTLLAPNAFAGDPPVKLEIEAPELVKPGGWLLTEGWAMTISLEVENAVAFVAEHTTSFAGDAENRQALVFDDPDGCLDMRSISPGPDFLPFEAGCTGQDEGFFEFFFDPYDAAAQRAGRCVSSALPYTLVDDEFSAGAIESLNKQFVQVASSSVLNPRPVGAQSGGMRDMTMFPFAQDDPAFDCYGYGADVNGVPGLVVWADIGGFKVMTEHLTGTGMAGEVRRLRNGAGFITNVTSVFVDSDNKSYVKATIIVPLGLFDPIIAIDTDINPSGPYPTADYLRKIDDGPIEALNYDVPPALNVPRARKIAGELPPIRVRVKAVLVDGPAPDFITDVNMDGRFTRADLVAEGYTLLSNVDRYKIRALRAYNIAGPEDICPPNDMMVAKDLDGADPVGPGQIYFCSTGSARSGRRVPR